jgi:hypothetical protein
MKSVFQARFKGRDWLCASTGALSAVLIFLIAGARPQDDPKSIECGELRVVQPDGTSRISMRFSPEIGAVLSFNGARGRTEIGMMIKNDGEKAIILNNAEMNSLVGINLKPDGTAHIGIQSLRGPSVHQIVQPDGSASLQFRDKSGKTRIKLGLDPDGSPGLEFFDKQGKKTFNALTSQADEKPAPEKGEKK